MANAEYEDERRRLENKLSAYRASADETVADFTENLKEQRSRLRELHEIHSSLRPEIRKVNDALDELERSFNRQVTDGVRLFTEAVEKRLQSVSDA